MYHLMVMSVVFFLFLCSFHYVIYPYSYFFITIPVSISAPASTMFPLIFLWHLAQIPFSYAIFLVPITNIFLYFRFLRKKNVSIKPKKVQRQEKSAGKQRKLKRNEKTKKVQMKNSEKKRAKKIKRLRKKKQNEVQAKEIVQSEGARR